MFHRVVSHAARELPSKSAHYVDVLLTRLRVPIELVWGEYDPWIRPHVADRMEKVCAEAGTEFSRVSISAGHCPMDEAPAEVNAAIAAFCSRLPE